MSLLDKILNGDLFKAAHGRYADNAKNRRLHRVGQEYGHTAKEEVPGPGRKPAQQDDEQKNPLATKLDTLSPTQLSKLVDFSEKKLKEFKDKGYEHGAKKFEEIAREAKKRLMGDEAYEKKDLVQRVRDSVSDEKDPGKVEQDWEDKIRDYIFEHYPTQANVTAETNSPKGREERERMKNDPELKRMLEQQDREFEEADNKKQTEEEPAEEKKPTKEEQEAREKEVQSKVSALGKKLVQTMKDGGDTKGVEKEISEALKEASDKQLRDTAIALKSSNQTPAVKRALKLTEKERNRRKQASGLFSDTGGEEKPNKPEKKPKTEEKPTESEGKGNDDVEVEARMTFDDIPNSGKVKMAKYLSGARKNKVDSDFKAIKGLDDATVQTLHDGLVKKFNDEFDDMRKADRAEALYKIAKVKNELQKRFNALLTTVSEGIGSKKKLPDLPKYKPYEPGDGYNLNKNNFEAWRDEIGKLEFFFDGQEKGFEKLKSFNDKLAKDFDEKHPSLKPGRSSDFAATLELRDHILSSDPEKLGSHLASAIRSISNADETQLGVINKALIERGYQPVVRADMYYKMENGESVNSFVNRTDEERDRLKDRIKQDYKKLPEETQAAIKRYTAGGWKVARYDNNTVMNKPIDDYVRSTPLKEDIMLVRGINGGTPESSAFIETIMNTPIGGTYKADGFSSFTANKLVSSSFVNSDLKISMVGRKGQKIAPLYGGKSKAHEIEFIPPTNSTFRVLQKGLGSVVVELVDE